MRVDISKKNILGDGVTDYTVALQNMIDMLSGNGGGELYFPAGTYLTGSLYIKSNITINLGSGAILAASGNDELYPVITQDEVPGFTRGTRRGILYSIGEENITIKGEGIINGGGKNWWNSGMDDGERPRTVQFIRCSRIRIEGISIINSPCWTINPICCTDVVVSGITIRNPYESPNTDGINPESCKNVRISDCCVDVGDDCITIKSGLETDTLQKQSPCENITVTNCTLIHGHGGVVIGSEMSGGIRNVAISNCVFQNTDRGIRIKTRRKRGGCAENITVSNLIMDSVMAGITVNAYYQCGAKPDDMELFSQEALPAAETTPMMKDMLFSNIIMKNVRAAGIYLLGLPEMPVQNIRMTNLNITVEGCADGEYAVAAHHAEKSFGDGIVLEHAKDTYIDNCFVTAPKNKFIMKKIKNVWINGDACEKNH